MGKIMGKKVVFIDRDGTIIINKHYLADPEGVEVYPTVARGIKLLNEAGFQIIVATNQSGIARGLYTHDILAAIHQRMIDDLQAGGAKVDALYYCPHHPDDHCDCRKPETGLIEKAMSEHDLDMNNSYFVGDRMADVKAGYTMGCKTVLIPEKWDLVMTEMEESDIDPNYLGKEFIEGVLWILDHHAKKND